MHLQRQIWEYFLFTLSSHHFTELTHHRTVCFYVTIKSWTPGEAWLISNFLGVAYTSICNLDFADYIYTAPIQTLPFMFTLKVGINVILNCRSCSSGRPTVPVPAKSHVAQLEINTRGWRHGGDNDIPMG